MNSVKKIVDLACSVRTRSRGLPAEYEHTILFSARWSASDSDPNPINLIHAVLNLMHTIFIVQ